MSGNHNQALSQEYLEQEIERLRGELEEAKRIVSEQDGELREWMRTGAAQAATIEKMRDALQTYIDEHEECTDTDDWLAMMCSVEAHHVAEEALAATQDPSAALRGRDAELLGKLKANWQGGAFDIYGTTGVMAWLDELAAKIRNGEEV